MPALQFFMGRANRTCWCGEHLKCGRRKAIGLRRLFKALSEAGSSLHNSMRAFTSQSASSSRYLWLRRIIISAAYFAPVDVAMPRAVLHSAMPRLITQLSTQAFDLGCLQFCGFAAAEAGPRDRRNFAGTEHHVAGSRSRPVAFCNQPSASQQMEAVAWLVTLALLVLLAVLLTSSI